jgi:hypothetical protein
MVEAAKLLSEHVRVRKKQYFGVTRRRRGCGHHMAAVGTPSGI